MALNWFAEIPGSLLIMHLLYSLFLQSKWRAGWP